MRIVEVPRDTVVVEVVDEPANLAVVVWAAELALRRGRDLTLVHGLDVGDDGGSGSDWLAPRQVIVAASEAGQRLLNDARAEVRRIAPTLRTRKALRLGSGRRALGDLAPAAAEVVVGDQLVADALRTAYPGLRCVVATGTKVPPVAAVGH